MVEVIEKGDCELARCAQQIAKCRGSYFGMRLEIFDQAIFCGVGGGSAEIQIGRYFHDAVLTFHREQHGS